ncbi:hypothetical protein FPSE_06785 [Fusarium pseudograminearum CS3096]|uniref:Uncharacterized protein n=1 Tax=Fusarium pseudograminearum (strain CS3096) TaxID=1028729 RepID=K3VFL8_FUSPC|nr:hypothetical protein FPSE_06785 [Fusarium pseudograminearum CS3096]EKJ72997.1 hypothetical protein FPSE_06785 [Fusarium pseudograminearum CS3096]
MTEHDDQTALHRSDAVSPKPNIEINTNYLISKDSTKHLDGIETTEKLLAVELQFIKSLPGQWVMHLKILEKNTTLNPKISETAAFKITESDNSKQSYNLLPNSPSINKSSPNTVDFQLDWLEKSRLCLAILFRSSHSPTFEFSFSRIGKSVDFANAPISSVDRLAPSEPTSDETPFSWALAHKWFDAFVSSDDETLLSWAARNRNLDVMKHLKTHATDRFESLLEHRDERGRTPISLAAGTGRRDIVKFLFKAGANLFSEDDENLTPLSWAASRQFYISNLELFLFIFDIWKRSDNPPKWWELKHLCQAARFGWITPADTFFSSLKEGNSIINEGHSNFRNVDDVLPIEAAPLESERIYHEKTTLCIAAEHGHSDIVQMLLRSDANVNFTTQTFKLTPLMLAITGVADEYAKARVVDLLLTGGAVISEKNSKGQTAEDLAINKRLPSVVTRLQWRSKDGPAAESADQLDQAVDALFLATVTTFKSEGDSLKGFVSERHDVSQLLLNQEYESTEEEEKQEAVSKWIHLPANNMRWVEVLISQLYKDKTQTYNILKPERWVRRQHHRGLDTSNATSVKPGIHHARFMRPLCQAFRSSKDEAPSKKKSPCKEQNAFDTNLVLFMPYLHWDITKRHTQREDVMKQTTRSTNPIKGWNKDQSFLNSYLFYKEDSQNKSATGLDLERHFMHQPHVRRTLDQYYYHELDNTRERDRDQVLSRAACQRDLLPESKVLAVVDQLWLWILTGKSGKPTTIVTCFPDKEPNSKNEGNGNGATDSDDDLDPYGDTTILRQVHSHMLDYPQTYLDTEGQDERLRFKEMYEMAIGDVMQQETELFDEFTAVMEVTKKEQKTKQSLKTQLNALSEVQTPEKARPQDTKQFQVNLTKRFEAVLKDLNDNSANQLIDFLVHSSGERITQEKVENLFKIAQLRVLDITKEVQLLHQIKDVQDELRIMSMIFRDQKVVIHEMEDIIQSIPSKGATEDPSESKWRKPTETIARELSEEDKTPDRAREKTPIQNVDGNTGVTKTSTNEEEDNVRVGNDELFSLANGVKSLVPEVTRNHIRHDAFFTSMAPKTGPSTSLDKKQRSAPSPRAIVQLSIDEIEDMIEGANNVYNALNLLIDLKQKQSNVMDARYARVQAEQSVKQGKTIMVFTIVTIVFLPLSFMAAFFAIDIHQFKRASDGKLSIGYVSEIMFPVSAFIIAFLIYIAFEIDSFESWWTKWTGKLPVVKKRKVGDVENPPSGNDNRRD